jgi:hypothetical protein
MYAVLLGKASNMLIPSFLQAQLSSPRNVLAHKKQRTSYFMWAEMIG